MRALVLAALLVATASAAWPQGFPAPYDVTGVARDDVLNIRDKPSPRGRIVGALAPDATRVEVLHLSPRGDWGAVSTGEGNGWVAMRFLAVRSDFDPGAVPRPMSCGGTEPFWTLDLAWGGDAFELMGQSRRYPDLIDEISAPQGFVSFFEEGEALRRTLTVIRAPCSDGMSERMYGFSAVLLTRAAGGDNLLFGCCTLDRR